MSKRAHKLDSGEAVAVAASGTGPQSYDPATGKFRVLLFPRDFGRPVYDWDGTLAYIETWSLDDGAVDLSRALMAQGISLLANHKWDGFAEDGIADLKNVVGKLTNPSIDEAGLWMDGELALDVELEWLRARVQQGVINQCSMGCHVNQAVIEETEGQPTRVTYTQWELLEGSLTPINAANAARILSASQRPNGEQEKRPMPGTNNAKIDEPKQTTSDAEIEQRVKTLSDERVKTLRANERELDKLVKTLGLEVDTSTLLEEHGTLDKAKLAVLSMVTEQRKPAAPLSGAHGIELGTESHEKNTQLAAAGILYRLLGEESLAAALKDRRNQKHLGAVKGVDNAVRRYSDMTLVNIGLESVLSANPRMNPGSFREGLDAFELAKVSMGERRLSGQNSSSDFPIIANTVVNVGVRQRYMERQQDWKRGARRLDQTSFKPTTYIGPGRFPAFLEVKEGGTYQSGSWTEGSYSLQLKKWGRIVPWTWELQLADDYNMLQLILDDGSNAALRVENRRRKSVLLANLMPDGVTSFFTGTNTSSVTGTPSTTVLKGAMKMLARQTGEGGVAGEIDAAGDYMGLAPRLWYLGVDDMTDAEALLGPNYVPTTAAGAVTPRMRRLADGLIQDEFLDDQAPVFSIITADPSELAAFAYGYLRSEGGPVFEQERGFDVDGLCWKGRNVFEFWLVEPKGAVKITRS